MAVIAYRRANVHFKILAPNSAAIDDYQRELRSRISKLLESKAMQDRHGVRVISTEQLIEYIGVGPFSTHRTEP